MKNASQPMLEKFLMAPVEKQKQVFLIFIMREIQGLGKFQQFYQASTVTESRQFGLLKSVAFS